MITVAARLAGLFLSLLLTILLLDVTNEAQFAHISRVQALILLGGTTCLWGIGPHFLYHYDWRHPNSKGKAPVELHGLLYVATVVSFYIFFTWLNLSDRLAIAFGIAWVFSTTVQVQAQKRFVNHFALNFFDMALRQQFVPIFLITIFLAMGTSAAPASFLLPFTYTLAAVCVAGGYLANTSLDTPKFLASAFSVFAFKTYSDTLEYVQKGFYWVCITFAFSQAMWVDFLVYRGSSQQLEAYRVVAVLAMSAGFVGGAYASHIMINITSKKLKDAMPIFQRGLLISLILPMLLLTAAAVFFNYFDPGVVTEKSILKDALQEVERYLNGNIGYLVISTAAISATYFVVPWLGSNISTERIFRLAVASLVLRGATVLSWSYTGASPAACFAAVSSLVAILTYWFLQFEIRR